MSDTWEEIQALKSKRNILREKLQKRKKEREGILNFDLTSESATTAKIIKETPVSSPISQIKEESLSDKEKFDLKKYPEVEDLLLNHLCDVTLALPVDSDTLYSSIKEHNPNICEQVILNFLQKFATQGLITVKNDKTVINTDHAKLQAMVEDKQKKQKPENPENDTDIMSLISMPTIKEKETKKVGEEILDLLSKPTAKERSLAERFRSQGGAQVMEFCPHGTRNECKKNFIETCNKLHFKKIIQSHTDESLGDCSFLNTCFHMDTCKYVHYEVDNPGIKADANPKPQQSHNTGTVLYPPQWIQCDLRIMDMSVLGKFSVIMADPPWDIHMELPYGTLSDDEMRQLGVPQLQDEGLIFLWVTGRAMELGRECLKLWGYDRVDELIWVKTNQLQRIIRTGRTGHWMNHGKEHCLVGLKGDPSNLNRGLDCDVIVAEVRATSHKPDEIYGIIERLSPGTRKIELFGRPHNVQPNWITLGNQVEGVRLVDPELIEAFRKAYPDGNAMLKPLEQNQHKRRPHYPEN